MLEARHQIFNGLHPAPFIEDLSLGLNDALLGGLALPANVIYLLLQGAAVGNLMVQRGLKCLALPFNAALSAWAVATCSRSVSLESRAAFSSPDKFSMIARSGATAAATAFAAARPSASALTSWRHARTFRGPAASNSVGAQTSALRVSFRMRLGHFAHLAFDAAALALRRPSCSAAC
jgi:hypothetical protein